MGVIRQAQAGDASRIAEILVFNNRLFYFPIFRDESYSFGKMQVVPIARSLADDQAQLRKTSVCDDGIIRGFMQVDGTQIDKLYVDPCFQSSGIGSALLAHAVSCHGADRLWALEKNARGLAFYKRHGFCPSGAWTYEEGTRERSLLLVRT